MRKYSNSFEPAKVRANIIQSTIPVLKLTAIRVPFIGREQQVRLFLLLADNPTGKTRVAVHPFLVKNHKGIPFMLPLFYSYCLILKYFWYHASLTRSIQLLINLQSRPDGLDHQVVVIEQQNPPVYPSQFFCPPQNLTAAWCMVRFLSITKKGVCGTTSNSPAVYVYWRLLCCTCRLRFIATYSNISAAVHIIAVFS